MLPLTTDKLESSRMSKLPVKSRFPLTDESARNPLIILMSGFLARTTFEPTVVRFGNVNDVRLT
jgi:hypothetical protein